MLALSIFLSAHLKALKPSLSIRQDSDLASANVGESMTFQCFYEVGVGAFLYWYKQTLGQKPQLISTLYMFDKNGSFHDEFKNDSRFKLETENNGNHLTISDLRLSDSATYFCVRGHSNNFEFGDGVTLSVKGSGLNIQAVVHQSESQTIQPGDSVTLNCTMHTGTCDGEHSVYWFRSSGHPQPRAIYIHGVTDDQCERKPTTHTQTCDYNLPMKSLDLSDAGTYYCAVLSCGEILFGNGTKKDTECKSHFIYSLYLMVCFQCAWYLIKKTIDSSDFSPTRPRNTKFSCLSSKYADNLHYAALSENKVSRSRRQRDNTDTNCTLIRLCFSEPGYFLLVHLCKSNVVIVLSKRFDLCNDCKALPCNKCQKVFLKRLVLSKVQLFPLSPHFTMPIAYK
uniref:Ig-like domain-containing protein n=1 Tax=Myripristis murdjan TaxID=586833 RepID=A0A667ZIB0_9TELE